MSRITKQMLTDNFMRGKEVGYHEGFQAGKKAAMDSLELRRAQIQLINAVGQALQAQSSTIQGLAQALDCAPRL